MMNKKKHVFVQKRKNSIRILVYYSSNQIKFADDITAVGLISNSDREVMKVNSAETTIYVTVNKIKDSC